MNNDSNNNKRYLLPPYCSTSWYKKLAFLKNPLTGRREEACVHHRDQDTIQVSETHSSLKTVFGVLSHRFLFLFQIVQVMYIVSSVLLLPFHSKALEISCIIFCFQ